MMIAFPPTPASLATLANPGEPSWGTGIFLSPEQVRALGEHETIRLTHAFPMVTGELMPCSVSLELGLASKGQRVTPTYFPEGSGACTASHYHFVLSEAGRERLVMQQPVYCALSPEISLWLQPRS